MILNCFSKIGNIDKTTSISSDLEDDGVYFRVCKVLQGILTTLDDLPLTDPTNQELFDKLETVRAKVKQVRNY